MVAAETSSSDVENDLSPVLARPPMPEYIGGLWFRRHFIATVPMNHVRSTNMDTVLGNLWFLVNPALQTVVYFLIFGVLLDTDRGIDDYLTYLVIGVLSFTFITSAMLAAARCLEVNLTLIRSMYFPRAAIPISTTLASFYTFVPSLLVMVGLVLATGNLPSWRWLLFPVVLTMLVSLTLGVVFVVARLGKAVPDLQQLLSHIIRILFYCSGVLFAPESFTSDERVLWLFRINPFFELIELLRWVFLGRSASWEIWVMAGGWSVAFPVVGAWYFWRGETSYGTS